MPLTEEIRTKHKRARLSSRRYRLPMQVTEVLLQTQGDCYPICPRCDCSIDREYMNFGDRYGQHLAWQQFDLAEPRRPSPPISKKPPPKLKESLQSVCIEGRKIKPPERSL